MSTKFSRRHFIHVLCGKIIFREILNNIIDIFSKVSLFIFNWCLRSLYHENIFPLNVIFQNRNGIKNVSTWLMNNVHCHIQTVHQWNVSRVRWNPVQDKNLYLRKIHCNIILLFAPRGMLGAVDWDIVLQVWRSRLRFPMLPLEFIFDIFLWSTHPLTEKSNRNIYWG
jgi:hypothetical protein